ncbi:MAG: CDP-tyvelose epimerase [Acidobacteria bacterium]|nr:MAG: CDP-tyvelose epimerase [Acidobacteriota bacterium]
MKLLITGICGFAGSAIAQSLLERIEGLTIVGIDNLLRSGSETNRLKLRQLGVKLIHGDLRMASDFETLTEADCVIDAAANPSVLAGRQQEFTSRQLFEHNLAGFLNVLEYCKTYKATLILLSSSRVYSIPVLESLPLKVCGNAFRLDNSHPLPCGVSPRGISSDFATTPPVSLYGSMKLASEAVALEYGAAFAFTVWINRCGVLAGAGQFGTPDQGIFSYWINAHLRRRPLRYIGFDGTGRQVRDMLHPRDLAILLECQIRSGRSGGQRIYTAGGGVTRSISLADLNAWCDARFGRQTPEPDPRPRPYDVPYESELDFGWVPQLELEGILDEIASHAQDHPDWLERSGL